MASLNILVTGGAGFLGSHLCEQLLAKGHQVTCLDNLYTGTRRNIESLRQTNRFQFIEQSVLDPLEGSYDRIYNLACPASPPHYQNDPIFTFKTSIFGTLNVLELAERTGARVFQASTSEIYGDPLIHPQPETYHGNVNPHGIRACYDEGKRGAETLCQDFRRKRGVSVRVGRLFNTYGPGMSPDDGRVVSNFIMQSLRGQPISVFGDGSQTRSFCYRDDMVDAIIRLMEADDSVYFPVNLGNPGEYTMLELAACIQELTGSQVPLAFHPLPQDDPLQRCPDITLAQRHLDWQPTTDLRQGLEKTIAYFRGFLD